MLSTEMKEMTDIIAKKMPKAFQMLYPRNITPPTGYCNPRHYSASLAGNMAVILDPKMNQLPHMNAYMVSLMMATLKVPTYFIAYEFCQAVANTDLPGDFKFNEIKWPLDAMLFVLPDQFVRSYFGCYAPFIALCHVSPGMYPKTIGTLPRSELPYPQIGCSVGKIVIDSPVYPSNGIAVDYNGSYPMDSGIEAANTSKFVDSTAYEEEIRGYTFETHPDDLDAEAEKVFMSKSLAFAAKLILAMSCRPGVVENGQCTRPLKIKQGRVYSTEMWSPNMIGRAYKIPRQGTGHASSGAKPRFVYRRGHYAWAAKRFKNVEFISVDKMPRKSDGCIDFDAAGTELSDKFRTVHERCWIEGILFGDQQDTTK